MRDKRYRGTGRNIVAGLSKLDELAEAVKTKPCHAMIGDVVGSEVGGSVHCGLCGARSTTPPYLYTLQHGSVINTDDPVFKVLWMMCGGHPTSNSTDLHPESSACKGTGYVRRSLNESAMLLPGALRKSGRHVSISDTFLGFEAWVSNVTPHKYPAPMSRGEGVEWEEALAAAELDRRSHE